MLSDRHRCLMCGGWNDQWPADPLCSRHFVGEDEEEGRSDKTAEHEGSLPKLDQSANEITVEQANADLERLFEPITLQELYQSLRERFGERSDPDTWWPIYYGRTEPASFERAITNILVRRTQWMRVEEAVTALDQRHLLTAEALVKPPEALIAETIAPARTGLETQKARILKALAEVVVRPPFRTEQAFCTQVTRDQLHGIWGISAETADRTLLYACNRLAWPVDTYCLRVFAYYGLIPTLPVTPATKRQVALEIKQMVEEQLPREVNVWQRFHALMQLEGEALRRR